MPNQNIKKKKKADGRIRVREENRDEKSEKIGRKFYNSILHQSKKKCLISMYL